MDALPRVSVVIPTYDRARFLTEAVRSVLGQTHANVELIVVDDGSTDDTAAVLDRFPRERLQVIRTPHSGSAAHARNVGLSRATGRFVAFLDSDDVWLPTKLERQLAALRGAPQCGWCYTRFDHIDATGAPMEPVRGGAREARSGWVLEPMLTDDAIVLVPSILVERSLVEEVGPFDETPELTEDVDFCLRLAERSEACAVEDVLVRVRHHPGRTTYGRPEVRDWRVHAFHKLASRTNDPRIRRLCHAQSAKELIGLAEAYDWSRRPADALRALGRAFRLRPHEPRLGLVLAKTLVRPLMPRPMMDAYRRARARRPAGEEPAR